MAMKLYNETDVQNIADSIRAKNGLQDTYKVSEMSTAIDNIPSGGNVVNGIIEQYKAENGTIDANTFVEFVNKYTIDTIGEDTQLSEISNSYVKSVAALSKHKVFIVYRDSNDYLYGIVCTISGTTITKGSETQLSSVAYSGKNASVIALSSNKVFIAHSYTNDNYLYGMVCTISGTTITTGTDTLLVYGTNTNYVISASTLSSTKVFIAHSYGSTSQIYVKGMVCTISGTEITVGTDTQIQGSFYSGNNISVATLNENSVFVACSYGNTSYYLYGLVCIISGTTITTGIGVTLNSTTSTGYNISVIALSSTKVFIAHSYSGKPYGIVCTISGTTITKGTDTQLSSNTITFLHIVKIGNNGVFAIRSGSSTLYGIVCTISGTTITKGSETQLGSSSDGGQKILAVNSNDNEVFIAHSHSDEKLLYGIITITYKTIQPSTSNIDGLTKTECSPTTAGDVFVLDESYVPLYNLIFNITPSNATIVVTDSSGNVVTPISAGNYKVPNGTYNYEITAEGYIPIRSQVSISDKTTITKTMEVMTGNELFNKVLQAHGGTSTIEAKGTPDFSQIATTDEGMYMAEDDLGKSYYFRGTAPDNYVSFAGKTWRIVRINGDNSVRLISADTPITSQAYNSSHSDNMYMGYKYTSGEVHGLGTNSNAKTQLETWYTNNLESYDNYIADQIFINDRRPYTDSGGTTPGGGTGTTWTYYAPYVRNKTNKAPSLKTDIASDRFSVGSSVGGVPTNASCTKKIGMLTTDEVYMAGGVYGSSNSSYYLYTGASWWLGSPSYLVTDYANGSTVSSGGSVSDTFVDSTCGLRPIISLLPSVLVLDGTGTSADPYVIDTTQS